MIHRLAAAVRRLIASLPLTCPACREPTMPGDVYCADCGHRLREIVR